MFIRWKKTGKHSFAAVLVESRRVGGKPRQKIIKYLAMIRDCDIEGCGWDGKGYRKPFWTRVEHQLDSLGLRAQDRAKIADQIARRVPQWTPEDEAQREAISKAQTDAYFAKCAEKRRQREEKRFQNARSVQK